MGYSPQKTPFDLTDFLSKPGSPKSRKWKRFALGARPAAEPAQTEAEVAAPEAADKA